MQFEFDVATRLVELGDHRYCGEIQSGWDINGNANGGYLLALLGRAMRTTAGRIDPISITAHYLAPGRTGPIAVETSIVKQGRQLVTVAGSICQGDREILRALGTFGDIAGSTSSFQYLTKQPPEVPPFAECLLRRPNQTESIVGLVERLDIALHPRDSAYFETGQRSGQAKMAGWFSFGDSRPSDTLSLLLAIDAFPPPVFNIDIPPGWVPTVELTAHIFGVPAPGPLRCQFVTEVAQHGYFQEDGEIWDSSGQLVAQSRQLALLPRG
jgi:acyl-CoA thioesterase